jgi:hypothetical protein
LLKKSKSSSSLSHMFAKINRSSKDLTAAMPKDKENTTPPASASGHVNVETPVWAQFSSSVKPTARPSSQDGKEQNAVADEIARYTPQEYSPSKQRNFNGTLGRPGMRPTLSSKRQSTYAANFAAIGRRVSGQRHSMDIRRSDDSGTRSSKERRRVSGEKVMLQKRNSEERKVSGSSTEQAPLQEKLNVMKRGSKVMAAVAALQGRNKGQSAAKQDEPDPQAVDDAFEAVLESRNIPEPQRQKMRSLTLRVKQDFIKQDQGLKTAGNSPVGTVTNGTVVVETDTSAQQPVEEEDPKATKRSRARSRTFTFTKGDKRSGDASPAKKRRSQSKSSRPTSLHISTADAAKSPPASTPTSPFASTFGRKAAAPSQPSDYITYLKKNQDATKVEVGRLHKLRLLLRNETVAWVDTFLSLGGMTEIVGLLHRTMAIEWREEHEDNVLQEALSCLKGLCTTERAMGELEQVADELFPALIAMLFDEEKKGPAEYTTRGIIINVLCTFPSQFAPNLVQATNRRC